METYVYWFLLALVLLGLEMASGTFYLLVVSVALAAGGLAALLGTGIAWQLVLSALVAIIGTLLLRNWKGSRAAGMNDDSLDVGQPVQVLAWHENGMLRVAYRGAEWDATLETADTPRVGTLYIAAVHGASLLLTHRKPA